jgi:serine/threonine-protein phosphatase 4 regulatory subunit 1
LLPYCCAGLVYLPAALTQRSLGVALSQDTARQVGFTADVVAVIADVIEARVVDKENDVRLTLAEQIAELGEFYMKEGDDQGYEETVEMLLSQVGKLLTDKELTVRQAAGVALVSIAKGLTKEHLESPVLGMVLCLAHDESEDHRALAAQLLNDMAEAFGKNLCSNFCVPELRSLAEDPEFGVRKAAARNMAHICRTIGQETSEEKMLPVFTQLSKDEIWGVRKSCAEALSDMSACMPSSCRSEQLVQVFTRLSSDMSRWVRFAAFQQLGPLIATMEPEEVSNDILKQFTSMAHGEGETTLYCAFNFPGVLQTVGASRWDLLKDSYMVLVKDVQWKVRRSLSHSLHEVAAILGREYTEECLCEQVFDVFIKDLDEVRVGALKNFAGFMKVLSTEKRKTVRLPLLRCESEHACRTLLTAVPVYAASSTWRC